MKRYQELIGRINYALFLVMLFLLPFPQKALRYVGIAWIVSWFLDFRWLHKPLTANRSPLTVIPFIAFGAWFLIKLLSGLWSPDLGAWGWKMVRYLAFGMLVPVGIWGVNEHYDWLKAGRVWVIGCLVAVPAYIAWMTFVHLHPEIVPYLNVPDCWENHAGWFDFFSKNISHFKHRLVLDSVMLLGAVIALQVYKNKKQLAVILPVLLLFIALTDSRQAVLSGCVMAVILIRRFIPQRWVWHYRAGVVLLISALCAGLVTMHPRMRDVGLNGLMHMRELSYDHDVRLNIWGAALQQPSDYLAFGLGAGQSTAYLTKQYEEADLEYYAKAQYNTHNQYLEEMMESGIGGLLLFIVAWLSIPFCVPKENRLFAILFTVLFMLNMCTECMFGRFCGIMLGAAGMLFALSASSLSFPSRTA